MVKMCKRYGLYCVIKSLQGKLVSATYKQTESYLSPLFRMLKRKVIKMSILVYEHSHCLLQFFRPHILTFWST